VTVRKTPNQVIAYNLHRARELHGWTQETAAERLEPFLGERWSRVVFSAAERSYYHEHRIRQFTADDIAAFAAAFELPISFFFTPPVTVLIDEYVPPNAREGISRQWYHELATARADEPVKTLIQERYREMAAAQGLSEEEIETLVQEEAERR
jgi:transcriptional regulator with XRE-family HTH domain